jgi:hypothetical protein
MARLVDIESELGAERDQNKAAGRWIRDRLGGARSANDRHARTRCRLLGLEIDVRRFMGARRDFLGRSWRGSDSDHRAGRRPRK